MEEKLGKRKVLVIGLDGATFRILKPLMERNLLPNLRGLVRDGVHGILTSTIPALTGPAWVSFQTGVEPGKHGIFNWGLLGDYVPKIANSRSVHSAKIWEILAAHNMRTTVINLPVTYPPASLNGVMISGMLTPDKNCRFAYPEDLREKLGDYIIDVYKKRYAKLGIDKFLDDLTRMIRIRTQTAKSLMKEFPWDLFIVVFVAVDRLQHCLWEYFDPGHPFYQKALAGQYQEKIFSVYRCVDAAIGELVKSAPEPVNLIILSDHGFGPLLKICHLNNWLSQRGYLTFRKFRSPASFLGKVMKTAGLDRRKFALLAQKLNFAQKRFARKTHQFTEIGGAIDWLRTRAYVSGFNAVNVNLKGREPEGTVGKGREYEELRKELRERLLELVDEENGERIIEKVYFKEEIYTGPEVAGAPDLIIKHRDDLFATRPKLVSARKNFPDEYLLPPKRWDTGSHTQAGVLLVNGEGVRAGAEITGAKIPDVTATILYWLGVPLPRNMDGRVPEGLFAPEYLNARPVVYQDSPLVRESRGGVWEEGEEEAVKRKLEGLGYL